MQNIRHQSFRQTQDQKETKGQQNLQKVEETQKTKSNIKCRGSNEVVHLCINNKCDGISALICASQTCQCQIQHDQCPKANLNFIVRSIKRKIPDTSDLKKLLQKTRTNIIDKVYECMDKFVLKIDEEVKFIKICQIQTKLLKMMDEEQTGKRKSVLKPADSAQLWKITSLKDSNDSQIMQNTKQLLTLLKQQVQKNVKVACLCLEKAMLDQKNKYNLKLKTLFSVQQPERTQEKSRILEQFVVFINSDEDPQNQSQVEQLYSNSWQLSSQTENQHERISISNSVDSLQTSEMELYYRTRFQIDP